MLHESATWQRPRLQQGMGITRMTDTSYTLWLQTFLAVVGLGVGLILHLKWHPLRDILSDAWDMLISFSWLVPAMAALQLLSGSLVPWSVPVFEAGNPPGLHVDFAMKLLLISAQNMAALTHGFFPPWPLALALPLVISLLVWRVAKFPYRYDSRRKSPVVLRLLTVGAVLAWIWLGLEIAGIVKTMPEWLESLRLLWRWIAEALMMAGLQVWMIRLVMGWEMPLELNDQHDAWLALEQSLARWQGIMLLSALDLLLLLAWRSVNGDSGFSVWVIIESCCLFAGVPLVIAWIRAPWMQLGDLMMRLFLWTWWPTLGFFISGVLVLMLVHFAMASLLSWTAGDLIWAKGIRILIALVLATVRSWLFLAFVLTLLRHGLKTASPQERAH